MVNSSTNRNKTKNYISNHWTQ